MPPGTVYDADFQCNLDFPGTTRCALDTVKMCEKLYCKKGSGCTSKGEPPAEGTKCGENMWCYNGQCVDIGQRPKAIDGGWGKWGNWSACSRTCGGGASFQERECNSPPPEHHGRFCIGERKQVKICNKTPCDESSPSFRAKQCLEYNSKPFKGKIHLWTPYPQKGEMCKLHCMNEEHVFVELSPRVKDGTSCKPGTKNKCIFGTCRKVGCDFELDSNAVEDQCGTCNGDGSECKIIENIFNGTGNGYVKIVTFPKNSRNIVVTEQKPSQNTIAVGKEDGKTYYLNGDFAEQLNGDYDFGGVTGIYDHPTQDKETLVIAGPLKKPIILYEVFYGTESPGVKYTYAEMLSAGKKSKVKPVYNWDFLEFGACSTICGPGIKVSKPSCVEKVMGRVAEKFCEKLPKPEEKRMDCNEKPCKTKWKTGVWGKCSGCKTRSGTKTRTVECVREAKESGRDPTVMDDSNCMETKPATKELCCSDIPCPKKRRMTDDYNEKIEGLWYQINKEALVTLKNEQLRQRRSKTVSLNDNGFRKHVPLSHPSVILSSLQHSFKKRNGNILKREVCAPKIAKDHVPSDAIKLSHVPIAKKSEDVKLSDEAYEAQGDKVVDTLDFCHETVYTGKEAIEELADMKNNRSSLNPH